MKMDRLISRRINMKHLNQASVLSGFNAYTCDIGLQEAVKAYAGDETVSHNYPAVFISKHLQMVGENCGSKKWLETAERANKMEPVFNSHDKYGNLINGVEYDSSYNALMKVSIEQHLVTTLPYMDLVPRSVAGINVARSAVSYLNYGLEAGTSCPLTMTFAAIPVLEKHKLLFPDWAEKAMSPHYDGRNISIDGKLGVTLGMSMTSRVSGSDLRMMDDVIAEPTGSFRDDYGRSMYSISGAKWFTSAPNSDAFLTLAKVKGSSHLSCFLVPRFIHENELNKGLRIQRLKKKCGDVSNASSELEYVGAIGYLIGKQDKGVKEIMPMVNHTRLDCAVGSAGLMKRSLLEVHNFTKQRRAFGKLLIDHTMMKQDLADMVIESDGHTHLAMYLSMRMGQLRETSPGTSNEDEEYVRFMTGIAKYYICGKAPGFTYTAMEHAGGMGYINDFPYSRYYRQAPLNSIWEGSGNVQLLDLAKTIIKSPKILSIVLDNLYSLDKKDATHQNNHYSDLLHRLSYTISSLQKSNYTNIESVIKSLAEQIAIAYQAHLLQLNSTPEIAAAFLISHTQKGNNHTFGSYGAFTHAIPIDHILQSRLP